MINETFHSEMKSKQPLGFVATGLGIAIVSLFMPFRIAQSFYFISSIISGYQLGILTLLLLVSIILFGIS